MNEDTQSDLLMNEVTQSDLLKRAREASFTLVKQLLDFNGTHAADVQPHLDAWSLGGRLQSSLIAFLARKEKIIVPKGGPESDFAGPF